MNMNNLELEYTRNLHNLEKRKTSISSSSFQSLEIPAHLSHFLFRTNMFSIPCPYESLVVSHERDLLRDPLKSLFSIIN